MADVKPVGDRLSKSLVEFDELCVVAEENGPRPVMDVLNNMPAADLRLMAFALVMTAITQP